MVASVLFFDSGRHMCCCVLHTSRVDPGNTCVPWVHDSPWLCGNSAVGVRRIDLFRKSSVGAAEAAAIAMPRSPLTGRPASMIVRADIQCLASASAVDRSEPFAMVAFATVQTLRQVCGDVNVL